MLRESLHFPTELTVNMTQLNLTRRRVLAAAAIILAVSLTSLPQADAAWKFWPFGKKPVPPPEAVEVVKLSVAAGAALPPIKQYWVRNTLVIDLSAAGAQGTVAVAKPASGRWPVRLAFRVLPGQFSVLEVRGDQRVILPIRADGPAPVAVPLAPGTWSQQSAQLQLLWGAASAPGV